MKQGYVGSYYHRGYSRCMRKLSDIIDHPQRKEIENRLKIITFFDKYGAEATRKAFNKSRSTVCLWKQKLKSAQGRLTSLSPGNRAPLRRRKRCVHPFVEKFIITYAEIP